METTNVVEGFAPFEEWQTWYRVTGDLSSGLTPLVVAHGGPGCTHDYVIALAQLAERGRPVVHYDQVGGGRSTHLPEKGGDFWTVELFLREMENLLVHLGINDRYYLLGQSWGGMLGAEHGIRRPAGLKALVISNSPASMALWASEAKVLRGQLEPDVEAALDRHEAAGTTDDPEYLAATAGVLRPPRLSRRAQSPRGRADLRDDEEGPDGLQRHERPQRVLLHRDASRLERRR